MIIYILGHNEGFLYFSSIRITSGLNRSERPVKNLSGHAKRTSEFRNGKSFARNPKLAKKGTTDINGKIYGDNIWGKYMGIIYGHMGETGMHR